MEALFRYGIRPFMKLSPLSLVARFTLVAALLLTGTVLIFGFRSYEAGRQRAVSQWQERLDHEASMAALKVQGFIADVARDTRFLARLPAVLEYASGDPAKASAAARSQLEENFRALMLGKPVYAQVRLIGEADSGREIVRLDQTDAGVTVTPKDQLQQKGDRDYIQQSRTLPPDGIYLSDLDLNRDFGRITEPWTPMLRVVAPVPDAGGQRFGWIVINADLRPLLTTVEQQTASGVRLAMANDEGSYLVHPSPDYRFGADLGKGFNLLRAGSPAAPLMAHPWLGFTGGYPFIPGHPRRFHLHTGSDGSAALADLAGVRNQALLASALTALAGLGILVLLARLVTRRLRAVATALTHFETGGPAPLLNEHPGDEIGQLAAAFNRMSGKIADQVRTLETARAQADEASSAKDDFLAVMSHEIRTPLNAVSGLLHVLDRNRPAPHQAPILRSLHAATGQLTSLLNEALDWSKIKAGHLHCDKAPFALRPLLIDLELTHRPLAAQKGLGWTTAIAASVPDYLSGDALRLSQVLHNLLSNAVKFTSSGFVRLVVSWQEGQLTCRVEDSGIGIQESDIGRIFSPFDQAHGDIGRRFGGTGLGLSISRSLAELMGGRLTAESTPGDGSSFALVLPLPAAAAPASPAHAPPPEPLSGLHLMCVEDSALNREVLAAFLEEAGITFQMAPDGAAALTLFQSGPHFHAALLDLQLPDTNGIELAGRLRSLQPGLPLLALTAQVDQATRQACLAAGFNAFLTKPLNPSVLLQALAEAIHPAPSPAPSPEAAGSPPLLTDLFAHEPARLARVLATLHTEFQAAAIELQTAAAARDPIRIRRLRHKLHSAIAGLQLTALDQALAQLLTGDWALAPEVQTLLQQAAATCQSQAGDIP
jgi:two-component system, sensor histidine kinase